MEEMEANEEMSKGVAVASSRTSEGGQLLPTRSSLRLRKRAENKEVKPESNDRKRAAATTEESSGDQEEQELVEPQQQDDQSENDNEDNNQETSSALTPSRRSKRNRNVRTTRFLFWIRSSLFNPNFVFLTPLLSTHTRTYCTLQAIRLKGTAVTFYRRLHDLFFCQNKFEYLSSKRMQLKRVRANPPIYVIDNFLTPAELEYFDKKIASCPFEKSFVDNMDFEKIKDDKDGKKRQRRTIMDTTHRTSTFFGFRKLHDFKISALERRIAEVLGCWVHQIEALQLVRYLPGQFFGVHHDMGDLLADDHVSLPKKQLGVKRRLVTLFCYLNTLEKDQGGCTHFPAVNLRVKPKKGRAVLWSNITSEGLPEPRTIHAGESVQAAPGKEVAKYGLNIWICEE
jgi:prolyl 4-hydroxylase